MDQETAAIGTKNVGKLLLLKDSPQGATAHQGARQGNAGLVRRGEGKCTESFHCGLCGKGEWLQSKLSGDVGLRQ